MPRGYCLYPQNTDVNEFLDDGKTPNPARCPYRTRWKPYIGKPPTNNRCCQRAYVPIQARSVPNDKWVPATHVNFSDERPPSRPLALQNPKSCINQSESACYINNRCNYDENRNVCEPMEWKPNQNCPGGSICTNGNCVAKMGKFGPRERGCSNKYRCVLKDGSAWHRSCKGGAPSSSQHEEELKDDIGEEGDVNDDGDTEFSDEEDIEVELTDDESGDDESGDDESDAGSDWSVDLLGDDNSSDAERDDEFQVDEEEKQEYVIPAQEPQVSDDEPQVEEELFEGEKQEYVIPDLEAPSSDDDSSDDEPNIFNY